MYSVTPYLLSLLFVIATGAAWGSLNLLYDYAAGVLGNSLYGVGGGAVAVLTSLAILAFRIWKRRSSLSNSIVTDSPLQKSTQELARSIARRLSISTPQVAVVSGSAAREARVDFIRRRPIVVVPRTIAALGIYKPRHLEGLLAHELSHVANGDARRAAIARLVTGFAAGVIACCAALVAIMFVFSYVRAIVKSGWRYSAEVVLTTFASNAFQYLGYAALLICGYALLLQVREFYADAGAKQLGYASELEEMLSGPGVRWQAAWRQITAFHPPAADRVESLRDSGGIHELRFAPVAVASALAHACIYVVGSAFDVFEVKVKAVLFTPLMLLVSLPFVVIAFQYGARLSALPNKRLSDLARAMVKGSSAIVLGVIIAGAFVQFVHDVEAEAPYGQIALDHLWNHFVIGFFAAGALVGAMLAGNATTAGPHQSRLEHGLWILFAAVLAFELGQTSLLAAGVLILTDELKPMLDYARDKILQVDVSKANNYRDFNVFWGVAIGVPVAASAFGVGSALAASSKRCRRQLSRSSRPLLAMLILLVGAVCGGFTGYAVVSELVMQNSIWVSCNLQSEVTDAEKNELTRVRSVLLSEFVAADVRSNSLKGPIFYGQLEEGQCGVAPAQDRRPLYRRWLTSWGLTKDGVVLLSIDRMSTQKPSGVLASYVSPGDLSNLGRISEVDEAAAVVGQALLLFDPYRYARWLQVQGLDDSKAMQEAAVTGDRDTRSWALTQLARRDLSSGDATGAERKFLLALDLLPKHPIAAGVLTDIYLDSGRCDQAVKLLESIQRSDEFTPVRVQRAAGCQEGQKVLAYAYKHRRRFEDESTVTAFIGENAYRERRFTLADQYFQRSLAAEAERAFKAKVQPTRVGCVNLYVAIRGKTDLCVGDQPCEAPIDLQSGREHMCWAEHAAAYEKSSKAREHYEIAAKMDPALSDRISKAVANLQ
ncbi:M48 family metalloprotease [Variovorax fucosicus]|uniref:M48 family metalloprotease n=1 Tax=Variovorax fucosicus TaxID=3053517 RepID=UPI002576B8E9|nr:M48 family metalloprotease [Variovorax sp. J22G47]MDM0059013.1 M48 family metalloprotease [Variovorax sp. J22G47]